MSNIISQFFNSPAGTTFVDDSDLLDLASNSVITNRTTSEKFKKIDTNVFNKVNFGTVGSSQTPVYFSNGIPKSCSLKTVLGISSFSVGHITHGEEYIEVVLDVNRSTTSTGYPLDTHLMVRFGRISCGSDPGMAHVVWDTPMPDTDIIGDIYVQVTPTRGQNGGLRWGDEYFNLFTQDISGNGFNIYSNHLGDAGNNGKVDYIAMVIYRTH